MYFYLLNFLKQPDTSFWKMWINTHVVTVCGSRMAFMGVFKIQMTKYITLPSFKSHTSINVTPLTWRDFYSNCDGPDPQKAGLNYCM